jgi:hypothetical protein
MFDQKSIILLSCSRVTAPDRLEWVMKLHLPSQLTFAFAVVTALRDHQAVRYVRAPE